MLRGGDRRGPDHVWALRAHAFRLVGHVLCFRASVLAPRWGYRAPYVLIRTVSFPDSEKCVIGVSGGFYQREDWFLGSRMRHLPLLFLTSFMLVLSFVRCGGLEVAAMI